MCFSWNNYIHEKAKTTSQNHDCFQKSGKKGPIFPKKLRNKTTIPDNLIFCVSQSIGSFYETYRRLLRNFSNFCTRWDDHFKRPKARSHWMSYDKRNLCRDWKNHSTPQKLHLKIDNLSNGGVSAVCQEQPQKSCVKITIFCQKIGKKGPIFPKKWENRTTIPNNLIVCVSQSIGGFHETSQIFAHTEIITSNDRKRHHTGWATARGKEPVSRLEKPQHSRLVRNAQKYPILYLLQSIGGLQETSNYTRWNAIYHKSLRTLR